MAKGEIIQNIKSIFEPKRTGKISIYVQSDQVNDPEYFNQVENDITDLNITALSKDDAASIFDSLNKLKEL